MRALRRQMGMTQADLAGEEFTKSFISQIEKNQARPSLKSLRIFAQRLNRPVSYFLDDEDDTALTSSQAQRALTTGDLLERQGKYEEALRVYEQALDESAPNDYATRGQVYRRRARALIELDQRKAAVQALELAAEEFRLARDTAARAEVDQLLGDVHNELDQKETAITHYERALLLYEEGLAPNSDTEPSFAMLRLLTELGLTAAAVGKNDTALKYLRRAESLASETKTLYRWGDVCRTLSSLEKQQGNHREAVQYAERAVAYCDSVLDHVTLVRALVDLGKLRAEEGGRKAAELIFERALDVADTMGDADGKSRVRAALAELAEQDGDIKRAVELYEAAASDQRRRVAYVPHSSLVGQLVQGAARLGRGGETAGIECGILRESSLHQGAHRNVHRAGGSVRSGRAEGRRGSLPAVVARFVPQPVKQRRRGLRRLTDGGSTAVWRPRWQHGKDASGPMEMLRQEQVLQHDEQHDARDAEKPGD